MQYKGDDLDLRVPPARAGREGYGYADAENGNGRWTRHGAQAVHLSDTLWVDETVLACCNYAFDVAQANGSAEVGLEHLINAMTRVEAAARILENRGVREGQLRRESAALIASEVPVAQPGDGLVPRRTADLEEALRRAAELASRRGAPAGIDDLLWSLLHSTRETSSVLLLRRLTPNWQRPDWYRSEWARPRDIDPPPAPVPQPMAQARPLPVAMPVPLYDLIAQRMAAMEDGMRQLHADFAHERKQLAEIVRDVQRDIVSQRSDGASLRGDLGQRLDGLERSLLARTETSRIPVQLADRMESLEKAVRGGLGEGARNWAALGQRMQALETRLAEPAATTLEMPVQLVDRLTRLEHLIETVAGDGGRNWAALSERLGQIETYLKRPAADARNWPELASRLDRIEQQIASRIEHGDALGTELTARVAGMETALRAGFGETAQFASGTTERLTAIERQIQQPNSDAETTLLLIDERISALARSVETRERDLIGLSDELVDHLRAIEARDTGPASLPIDVESFAVPLTEQMTALDHRAGERNREIASAIGDMRARIAGLEGTVQLVTRSLEASAQAEVSGSMELRTLGELIARLGDQHETLSSAIADWRAETQSGFGIVNSRIDAMAAPPVQVRRPVEQPRRDDIMPAATDTVVPLEAAAGHSPTVRPEPVRFEKLDDDRRSRSFWWWLFGTDSVTRSNRDVDLKWQRMQQRMREARDRRRGQA